MLVKTIGNYTSNLTIWIKYKQSYIEIKWGQEKDRKSWQLKQWKESFLFRKNTDNTGSQLFWSLNHYLKGNVELQMY